MTVGWDDNPYYSPETLGLEIIASLDDPNASYSFDMLVVWQEKATGRLFWATDSGCSCPSPFEDIHSLDDLTEVTAETWRAFEDAVVFHCVSYDYASRWEDRQSDGWEQDPDYPNQWRRLEPGSGQFQADKTELLAKVSHLLDALPVAA